MSTIAETLKQNIAAKNQAAGMKAEMLTAEQRLNALALKSFFEHAKLSIQSQSQQGKLPKDIKVKAGFFKSDDGYQFSSIPRMLGIDRLRNAPQIASHMMSGRNWFAPLWNQFVGWAASEGLSVSWSWQHDGVGEWEWHELSVHILAD